MSNNLKTCNVHELSWISNGSCPWCERDKLYDEIELIKETFQAAVVNQERKGGQQVPYHGDFASIPPSVVHQMKWWIKRWNELLPKEFEP